MKEIKEQYDIFATYNDIINVDKMDYDLIVEINKGYLKNKENYNEVE